MKSTSLLGKGTSTTNISTNKQTIHYTIIVGIVFFVKSFGFYCHLFLYGKIQIFVCQPTSQIRIELLLVYIELKFHDNVDFGEEILKWVVFYFQLHIFRLIG